MVDAPPPFRVELVDFDAHREALHGIRDQVFVREQNVPAGLDWKSRPIATVSLDASALHWNGWPCQLRMKLLEVSGPMPFDPATPPPATTAWLPPVHQTPPPPMLESSVPPAKPSNVSTTAIAVLESASAAAPTTRWSMPAGRVFI